MTKSSIDALVARETLERLEYVDHADLADRTAALYRRWCQTIPFDNLLRRIRVADSNPELPGTTPDEFLASFLAHGAGGLCVPGAMALRALLQWVRVPADLVSAHYCEFVDCSEPDNHLTVVADVGRRLLVDPTLLLGEPIELGSPGGSGHTLPLSWSQRRNDGVLVIEVRTALTGRPGFLRVSGLRPRSPRFAQLLYARTQGHRFFRDFNRTSYVRLNDGDGAMAACGPLFAARTGCADPGPILLEPEQMQETLSTRFGYSAELVRRLPEFHQTSHVG
ncbi:MAG: hypothetical protein AAFY28_14135 [Actinomycetota bacterium]